MIRTTSHSPLAGIWRDARRARSLVRREYLTTARYEPILKAHLGLGQLDLLFETADESFVAASLLLDSPAIITRERSPLVWPAAIAAAVDETELQTLEAAIMPWLRVMARARPIAAELIRRFAPSTRFDRARALDLVGAAPLERSIPKIAPFVYARRFARAAKVRVMGESGAAARAVLGDIAAGVEYVGTVNDEERFVAGWYGGPASGAASTQTPDVLIAKRRRASTAAVVIETEPPIGGPGVTIDVPLPAPWDLMCSFDVADAPSAARFRVQAVEPGLREPAALPATTVYGGSAGKIVLALSPDASGMRGSDFEEIEIFARRLAGEGLRVGLVSQATDPQLDEAQLVHIFGAMYEAHSVAFAEAARERRIDYVFDLPPLPAERLPKLENLFYLMHRASMDDAELAHYFGAYADRTLDAPVDPNVPPEPTAEEQARAEERFGELAPAAAGIFCTPEDLEAVRAMLSPAARDRVAARGVFAHSEPEPAPIGHLVPNRPFALVHETIARPGNALYAAVAAERAGLPLVVTGPVYDVDYLQTLRAVAPNAIVLADADAAVVAALYRCAAVWVNSAVRPRSTAGLLRAVAGGMLPVLADISPLARAAGAAAPAFALTSIDHCAQQLAAALNLHDREQRVAALRERLLPRRDPAGSLNSIIGSYARAAAHA